MKILIVDDEPAIVAALKPILTALKHDVCEAGNSREALALASSTTLDLVLLDLGLPDADGCELIAKLKSITSASIIILSARHIEKDKVRALDEGADDYVNKPFGLDELLARIRVAERKRSSALNSTAVRLECETLSIDIASREVRLMGQEVSLSPKEFALLELLARHSGQVVTQRQMMIAGWNDPNVDGQYLRSYVALLRQKLEFDSSDPKLILTDPGVGYKLALPMIAAS